MGFVTKVRAEPNRNKSAHQLLLTEFQAHP